MIHRATSIDLPDDPQSIEKGIRRLATRGNSPGGQYGRWLLRYFGVPQPLEAAAKWMGQYHSRFSDLPVSLCEAQLWLWDRPPTLESSSAAWIHLGTASAALRRNRTEEAMARLRRATSEDPVANVEATLLAARLSEPTELKQHVRKAEALLEGVQPSDERDCYLARLRDQQAYGLVDHRAALALYESIPQTLPFTRFRREHGVAYRLWKLGDAAAPQHARAAADHAGDAGLVRFRIMALKLLAMMVEPSESQALLERTRELVEQIEHEDIA